MVLHVAFGVRKKFAFPLLCALLVNPLLGSVSSLEHGGTEEECDVLDRHTVVG